MADLLMMLASKGETGRLDVNLGSSTGQLYLMNGKPVDCCVGFVQGAEALQLLFDTTAGTFRFTSGGVPPNLLFPEGTDLSLTNSSGRPEPTLNESTPPSLFNDDQTLTSTKQIDSARSNNQTSNERFKGVTVVAVLAALAGALGLTIGSGIASIQHRPKAPLHSSTPPSNQLAAGQQTQSVLPQPRPSINHHSTSPNKNESQTRPGSNNPEASKKRRKTLSIPVVVRIEDGRVVEAYAAQPLPDREAFEATAVRLARQRRFDIKSGTETILLTITEK